VVLDGQINEVAPALPSRGRQARCTTRRGAPAGDRAQAADQVTEPGAVERSSQFSIAIACSRLSPHMAACGRRLAHTAGRSGWPKMRQRRASSSCTQGTPAGLPPGMPGMGLLIEGAMQQAAQWGRQSIKAFCGSLGYDLSTGAA
jgi:hypothetical protein